MVQKYKKNTCILSCDFVILSQVTVGLVYFMSVTHVGMVSLEFLPGGRYLRALYDVHVGSMKINNGIIGGRFGKNLVIDGRKVGTFYMKFSKWFI